MAKKKADYKEVADEYKSMLQRLQAEFENFQKRTEKDKADFTKVAIKGFVLDLLPIVDNFELALKNVEEKNKFVEGMELVYSQIKGLFDNYDIEALDPVGEKFNPYFHEALMQQESDKEDGIVLEVFQKGYVLNDIVIRHAKVKVSKKK